MGAAVADDECMEMRGRKGSALARECSWFPRPGRCLQIGAACGSVDMDLGSCGFRSHQVDINSLKVHITDLGSAWAQGLLLVPATVVVTVTVSLRRRGLLYTNTIY